MSHTLPNVAPRWCGGLSPFGHVLAAALAGMLVSAPATAQIFSGRVAARQTFEYDDNPLLTAREHDAVTASVTAPRVTITGQTETTSVELDGRAMINRFSDATFNSNDVYLKSINSWQGQVLRLGLAASFDYDTTRSSELTGSGIAAAGIRHMVRSVAPNFSFNLSPLDALSGTFSYSRTDYDSERYVDFESWNLTPAYTHAFSPRDVGQIMIMASRFTTLTERWSEVDTIGPVAGWDRTLTKRLQVSGYAGRRFSTARNDRGEEVGTRGYLANLALSYEGLQDDIHFSYDRNLSPLGSGAQVQSDKVEWRWDHAVSSLVHGELRLQYIQQTGLDDNAAQDRTYVAVEPRLRFQLTEYWDITPAYRGRHQVSGVNEDKATSHAVFITVGYKGGVFGLD